MTQQSSAQADWKEYVHAWTTIFKRNSHNDLDHWNVQGFRLLPNVSLPAEIICFVLSSTFMRRRNPKETDKAFQEGSEET